MPFWSNGRVVLLGDACWCVSPLAGQGASMAIAGAWVLAEELSIQQSLDIALSRYERRLRTAISRQQRAARRIAKWFVPETSVAMLGRDLVARVSTWPLIAPAIGRRLAAQSIFRVHGRRQIEHDPYEPEVTVAPGS